MIALVNQRDQYHQQAYELASRFEGYPLLTTDVVLLEIGNALARSYKDKAFDIIEHFFSSDEVEIVRLNPQLFEEAFALYKDHQDKAWDLVDCISFVVMGQAEATQALTFNQHFIQAGFQALMG